ncbi:AsnC family transcriptional regulator [Streptomyces sp. NPDC051020]|uniref:AsnC family transcriptional regulator n=1 Tax=Streptomyces sp. NPDC051020 TaxID=3155409 RepID=UPI003449C606
MDLDHTDLAVVRELQTDGRLTYETLAQRVGLSRPATRARVQRLILDELERDGRLPFAELELAERVGLSPGAARARTLRLLDGGVAKVLALVRPELLGLGFLCGFAVRLDGERDPVARHLAAWDRVSFLSACVGRAELVGTISAESLAAVRETLEDMRACTGVRAVESWIHLELIKERCDLTPNPS